MAFMSHTRAGLRFVAAVVFALFCSFTLSAQSSNGQAQNSQALPQSQQDNIPDAPSTVQPPPPVEEKPLPKPTPDSTSAPTHPTPAPTAPAAAQDENPAQPPPPMPPVETVPPGTTVKSGPTSTGQQELYKLVVSTNFVQVPVTVKDTEGRRVDGLLATDFAVYENDKKQDLKFFTSDPFELSVAIVIDVGMPDVAVQKINQTYPALVGAFSPYDEVALYTYSSTVSQVSDFGSATTKLAAVLNQEKTVRGSNNGPPVLSGPLAPNGPIINGIPAGSPTQPVYTPPKEAHVLNDAILRAALDLSKRDKSRRKVIFVISDGRELRSKASYRDVLRLLLAQGIQVKAVVVDSGALPLFRQVEKLRIKGQGYADILPKYASATGGGQVYQELSRIAIEDAYSDLTSEARNQYTLGYSTRAPLSSAYRNIEVRVDRPNLKIYAKDGYYPAPVPH